MRTLTSDEQRDLRQRVEQLAEKGPTRPYHRLRQLLTALVFVWPAVGTLLLACSLGGKGWHFYGDVHVDRIEATPRRDHSC